MTVLQAANEATAVAAMRWRILYMEKSFEATWKEGEPVG
jgi:hypothetical protein